MDFETWLEQLFSGVNMGLILAIMGISVGLETIVPKRFTPLVVLLFGLVAGFVITPVTENWRLWAIASIFYAGGASVFYSFVWTTILNKINLLEFVSDLLLKWKNRKTP